VLSRGNGTHKIKNVGPEGIADGHADATTSSDNHRAEAVGQRHADRQHRKSRDRRSCECVVTWGRGVVTSATPWAEAEAATATAEAQVRHARLAGGGGARVAVDVAGCLLCRSSPKANSFNSWYAEPNPDHPPPRTEPETSADVLGNVDHEVSDDPQPLPMRDACTRN
jgi:hypothetical protein